MRHVESLEELFVGKKPLRFNRHTNRLHIDMDWDNDVETGEYIIVDGYQILDGDTYTDIWGDRWLARYTTALIKRQWGQNMSKFQGVKLPGGIELNGREMYEDAEKELERIREIMSNTYEIPPLDMIG